MGRLIWKHLRLIFFFNYTVPLHLNWLVFVNRNTISDECNINSVLQLMQSPMSLSIQTKSQIFVFSNSRYWKGCDLRHNFILLSVVYDIFLYESDALEYIFEDLCFVPSSISLINDGTLPLSLYFCNMLTIW